LQFEFFRRFIELLFRLLADSLENADTGMQIKLIFAAGHEAV
jgi:hypothetical protein